MGGIMFSRQSNTSFEYPERGNSKKQSVKRPPSPSESPTVKRIRTTYDHVYSQLFMQGEGSDITVETPTRKWKLHKIYIKQSPFFSAMLNGSWKDSNTDHVKLEFPDHLITDESLHLVFGSFYRDSLEYDEENVLNVLATATWFQLEDIRSHCEDLMCQIIKLNNVVELHDAADQYALTRLQDKCTQWLARCLMNLEEGPSFITLLTKISKAFMTRLLQYPKFYVLVYETDLLMLLQKWVFLQCNSQYQFTSKVDFLTSASQFHSTKVKPNLNGEFSAYESLFACIRWENVINLEKDALDTENIAPPHWVLLAYRTQWLRVLSCSEMSDAGPPPHLLEKLFWSHSERCGQRLPTDVPYSWRWCGFNFGVDLVFLYKNKTVFITRYLDSESNKGFSSLIVNRRIHLHLSATSLNSKGDVTSHCSTPGVKKLTLKNNDKCKILSLPPDMTFPIVISANILRFDPTHKPSSLSLLCDDDRP